MPRGAPPQWRARLGPFLDSHIAASVTAGYAELVLRRLRVRSASPGNQESTITARHAAREFP
jgi:hypothetical protein